MIRYQITDGTAHLDERRWLAGLNRDADLVQIREAQLTTRALARLVREVGAWARVLVNDRPDVALACGAAGVHLRSESIAPGLVRRIAPPGFLISVACHSADDVLTAVGADYALLAPIFQPLSKAASGPLLGVAALRDIAKRAPVPVIALGGITDANMAQCVDAGAAGVAGITLFRRPAGRTHAPPPR